MMEIGKQVMDRIDQLIYARKINYSELSRLTGIPLSTITTWRYSNRAPKSDRLELVAKALGVTPGYLLTGDKDQTTDVDVIATWMSTLPQDDAKMIMDAWTNAIKMYCTVAKITPPEPVQKVLDKA